MKPEIKAKMDEILKAHGMNELSLDALDQVAGGAGAENGIKSQSDIDQLCTMVNEMIMYLGKEAAVDYVQQCLPNDPEAAEAVRTGGAQALGRHLEEQMAK